MKKIYFIDSENVGDSWLPLLSRMEDDILVFYTSKSPYMNYDGLVLLKESPKDVTFIKCFEGTNALDFQLVTELGFRLNSETASEYIIVTNDTGFDAAVRYWQTRNYPVRRVPAKAVKTLLEAEPEMTSKNETASKQENTPKQNNQPRQENTPKQENTSKQEHNLKQENGSRQGNSSKQDFNHKRNQQKTSSKQPSAVKQEESLSTVDVQTMEPVQMTEEEKTSAPESPKLSRKESYKQRQQKRLQKQREKAAAIEAVIPKPENLVYVESADEIQKTDKEIELPVEEKATKEIQPVEISATESQVVVPATEVLPVAETQTERTVSEEIPATEAQMKEITSEKMSAEVEQPEAPVSVEIEEAEAQPEAPVSVENEEAEAQPEAPSSVEIEEAQAEAPSSVETEKAEAQAEVSAPEKIGEEALVSAEIEETEAQPATLESVVEAIPSEEQPKESVVEAIPSEEQPKESVVEAIPSEEQPKAPVIEAIPSEEQPKTLEMKVTEAAQPEKMAATDNTAEAKVLTEEKTPVFDKAEVDKLINCIGKANLGMIHNSLELFYGEQGKEIYQIVKTNSYDLEIQSWNQEERFCKYCELVFAHSDMTEQKPEEFEAFLYSSSEKRKNLNALRSALQKRYGKDAGLRYYSLFKAHIKVLNRM